jgi:hypothetical protein
MRYVNGIEIHAKEFGYDGCHKIYLIESEADKKKLIEYGYDILPIAELKNAFENSCGLEFISNASLTTQFVTQFEEDVKFEGFR